MCAMRHGCKLLVQPQPSDLINFMHIYRCVGSIQEIGSAKQQDDHCTAPRRSVVTQIVVRCHYVFRCYLNAFMLFFCTTLRIFA